MASGIRLGLLLHFYQPWWQFGDVLSRIADECYRPILRWIDGRDGFAFSANVNWSLLELLHERGHDDVVELMRRAVEGGKIELFGTAAYHPILPLSDETEILRQIARDCEGKRSLGFRERTCDGFYLPEYAFSREIALPLKRAGFSFTVADDASFAAQHGYVPCDHIPKVDGLAVFLRARGWGNSVSGGRYDFDRFSREFVGGMQDWFHGNLGYVILATDVETFGHHHKRLIDWLLKPMVEQWSRGGSPVEIAPFQSLYRSYGPRSGEIAVPPGTWSTEPHDFVTGNFFPLWNAPGNIYHQALWRLVNAARKFGDVPELRDDVMKVLSSCSWWQVSGRPNFNPRLMMIGARKAMEIIEKTGDEAAKAESRRAYEDILRLPGINP